MKRSIFLILTSVVMMSGITFAAPGDLDTTFNPPNGYVLYNGTGNDWDLGIDLAIQSDGKIVVVGQSHNGIDTDVLVLRYNSDGTLDSSFGTNGAVTYDGGDQDMGFSVAVQSDGKIVVGGDTVRPLTAFDIMVLRYKSDGTLDNSFGTNGAVTYDNGSGDQGGGVRIQSDGKIVVGAGIYDGFGGTNHNAVVLRYNSDGTLDSSFGTNGAVTYNYSGGSEEWGVTVAFQSDGKILAVGSINTGFPDFDDYVVLLRYNSDGTLDSSFGTGGVVIYNGEDQDMGYSLAIQSDGKIVVLGKSDNSTDNDVLFLRYNSDGTLDSGFGTNGAVTHDIGGDDWGFSVAVQSDGKIVAVGRSDNGSGSGYDVLVLRLIGGGTGPNPPNAPTNLTATVVSSNQVDLPWTDNSTDEDGFKVERKTGATGTYSQIATVPADTTSYSDTNVTLGQSYYYCYRVRAYNAGGDSGYSNEAAVSSDPSLTGNFGRTDGSAETPCFIATAAYGSGLSNEVIIFKQFRDEYLLTNELGRALVCTYYKYSPPLAHWIAKHPMMRQIVRIGLYPVLEMSKWFVGKKPSE